MSSEASIRERAIRDHQAWLGFLQPDGLVVSPAALVDAQVVLDTRIIDTQERFLPFAETVTDDENDRELIVLKDLPTFFHGFLEWPEDLLFGADSARPVPENLIVPLAELGETLEPSYAFRDPKPKDPAQPWLLLAKSLPVAADLDFVTTGDKASWSASATRRFERLLRESRVPIGLLSNGTHLRLIYAPRGENSGSLTFPVAAMSEVAGRPILAALHELLSRYRLLAAPSEARLPALLTRSRDYQSSVSTELAQQVIDAAFDLLRGLQAANERTQGELLKEILATYPNKVYEGLLTALMRLVFLLFAEDRGLMPGGSLYQRNYAVHGLFERLRADHERYPDTMDSRYGAWAQLLALFRAVHGGCDHASMKLPARAGYLFDPDRFPFLEGRATVSADAGRLPLIPDGTIFRVLRKLLILDGERLSYRTLDVEQIGSVYEVMMGFGIGIAQGPSIAIKPKKPHGAPIPINLDELLKQAGAERAKWLKANTDQELSDKPGAALKAAKSIDDLLAALEQGKRIARSATPSPVPNGAMLLLPSDERRRSGSNYTPRSLTEPIVRKTLEPILKRLGDDATPAQILELKICDCAVGSGAFLVETCRQLAEVLVTAWHLHKQLPTIPPDEDELLYAKRLIAQRCLYGVDKNPMAADLAKLSLWLATLARDHPFTFLDHALRSGDSLVGLTRKQIASFTWEAEGGLQSQIWSAFIQPRIDEALKSRREILDAGDFLNPATKRQKLQVADDRLNLVRFIGDLAVAAFFAADKDKQRKEKRAEYLQALTEYLGDRSKLGTGAAAGDITKRPQKFVDVLPAGDKGVTPFHWEIEFTEVFGRENPGFDAIVGNPPFMGGTWISGRLGDEYFSWLKTSFEGSGERADLIAYFFRRAFMLLRTPAAFGLVATNTIAQGDTRVTGLRSICVSGGIIFAATKRLRWPGDAAVIVSVIHVLKVDRALDRESISNFVDSIVLDGRTVTLISAFLFHTGTHDNPKPLAPNANKSFKGVDLYGMGFTFDDSDTTGTANRTSEMARIIAENPKAKTRILPYIGGEEINDDPQHRPHRWAINLSDLDLGAARSHWPSLLRIVEDKVKPERMKTRDTADGVRLKEKFARTAFVPPLGEKTLRQCIDDYIEEQRRRYEHGLKFPNAPQRERISGLRFMSYRYNSQVIQADWGDELVPNDEATMAALMKRFRENQKALMSAGKIEPGTVNERIKTMRHVVRWLHEQYLIPTLPRQIVHLCAMYAVKTTAKALDLETIHKLWEHASPKLRTYMALGLNCGFNVADIAFLEYAHLKDGYIVKDRHKTGVPTRFKLWAVTQALLTENSNGKDQFALVTDEGGPLLVIDPYYKEGKGKRWCQIETDLLALRKRLKINGVTFSKFRDTSSTQIESIDRTVTDLFQGHKDGRMARFYLDGDKLDYNRLFAAFDKALDELERYYGLALPS